MSDDEAQTAAGRRRPRSGTPAPSSFRGPVDRVQARLPEHLRFVSLLAEGGMSTLVVAEDRRTSERVAVKLADEATLNDDVCRARFEREADLGKRFGGDGVVPVLEADLEKGVLVLPLLRGGSLKDRIEAGTLPAAEVRRIGVELLSTLARLHAAGVLHRDVKPSNVLFDDHGRVMLADLGVAREHDAALTVSGALVGTPAYMAPEQLRGQPIDARADVYAVGATLYEAATGRRLHDEDATATDPFDRLRDAVRDDAIVAAVARAVREDPAGRFPSAKLFAQALARRRFAQVRVPTLASLAFAALALALFAWLDRGAGATAPVVVILPFEGSGVDARSAVRVPQMLAQQLLSSGEKVEVISALTLKQRIPANATRDDLLAAARRYQPQVIVSGRVERIGGGKSEVSVEVSALLGDRMVSRLVVRDVVADDDVAVAVTDRGAEIGAAALGRDLNLDTSPAERDFQREYADGLVALHDNRWADAISRFEKANMLKPNDADVAYNYAVALWWASRPPREVRAAVTRAVALAPPPTKRIFLTGLSLFLDQQIEAARKLFADELLKNAEDLDLLYGLFEALYHLGRTHEAAALYRDTIVKLYPEFRLGAHHMQTHALVNADEALMAWAGPFFHGDTRADRAGWEAHVKLARGDVEGSIDALLATLEKFPEALALRNDLAGAYLIAIEPGLARAALLAGGAPLQPPHDRFFALAIGDQATLAAGHDAMLELLKGEGQDGYINRVGELIVSEHDPAVMTDLVARMKQADPDLVDGARVQLFLLAADDVAPDGRAEALVEHDHLEVRHTARALVALRSGQARVALDEAHLAIRASDGRFTLFQRELAARAAALLKDHEAVLRECSLVVVPRIFQVDWGARAGRCRIRMADAALGLQRVDEAKEHARKLVRLRKSAPEDDPLLRRANEILALP